MSYAYEQIGRVALVRWQVPTVQDVYELRDRLRQFVKQSGTKVFYIAVVPQKMPRLASDVQQAMMEIMDDLMEICAPLRLVFEGEGLLVATHRAMLVTILGIRFRGRDRKVDVHKDVAGALHDLEDMEMARRVSDVAAKQAL
jgi:hypothetical protein